MRRWCVFGVFGVFGVCSVGVLFALAACSSFSGTDATLASAADAQSASDSGDGSTTVGSTHFCGSQDAGAATILLCDDFDNAGRTSVPAGCYQTACWTPYANDPNGFLTDQSPHSAPHAARFSSAVDAGDGGVIPKRSAGIATLAFPTDKTKLTISAMIRPVGSAVVGDRALAFSYGGCFVEYASNGALNYRSCPGAMSVSAGGLQPDVWTRVTLSVERTIQGETVQLNIGEGVGTTPTVVPIAGGDAGVAASIQVVLGNTGADNTEVVDYDDVLVVVE